MARKLLTTVHLEDGEGVTHVFGPKDDLPGWAAKALTESWGDRDDLWETDSAAQKVATAESPRKAADSK